MIGSLGLGWFKKNQKISCEGVQKLSKRAPNLIEWGSKYQFDPRRPKSLQNFCFVTPVHHRIFKLETCVPQAKKSRETKQSYAK